MSIQQQFYQVHFRRALPVEYAFLSDLAFRSKSTWKYPPEYLEASRPLIALDSIFILKNEVWVGQLEDQKSEIFGFFAILEKDNKVFLDHFWIEPKYQSQGLGRQMFQKFRKAACIRGLKQITIHSDPPAEGFYLKQGARKTGELPSRIQFGPVFPVLVLDF